MTGELALFGEHADPPAAPSVVGVAWSRVTSSARCSACMAALVATNGAAPVAKTSRFRRRTATTDELLCHSHAQDRRLADGLPAFRAPRGA